MRVLVVLQDGRAQHVAVLEVPVAEGKDQLEGVVVPSLPALQCEPFCLNPADELLGASDSEVSHRLKGERAVGHAEGKPEGVEHR